MHSSFPYTLTVYLESISFDNENEEIDSTTEELESPDYTFDSLQELCQFLKHNAYQASESPLSGSITAWYISGPYRDKDYFEKDIHKTESYHLNGLDDRTKRQVARFMVAQNVCNE